MSRKKKIWTSFILAISYFSLSVICFFGGLLPVTDSPFLGVILNAIMFPSIIIFGVGYGSGGPAMCLAGIVVFLLIWLILLGLTDMITGIWKLKTMSQEIER